MPQRKPKLFEGLRAGDLRDQVNSVFTVDQFKSKMGKDKDIVVLGFKLEDKYPAIDLMEFIEKGYSFILDADMSTGEEHDGKYQVFVELERTRKLPKQIKDMLEGIGQLCDCEEWKFRYYGKPDTLGFSEEAIMENVPLDGIAYDQRMLESRKKEIKEFFDQGVTTVDVVDYNTIVASKPYSGDVPMELVAIGEYDDIKDQIPGAIQLDEASRSKVSFLEKYLGNYEIHSINNQFLIRNGNKGMIVKKERW
jgi:hypothetical protein